MAGSDDETKFWDRLKSSIMATTKNNVVIVQFQISLKN